MPLPSMDGWKIIVGLGNPGAEYARTRHNAGFMAVERLAARKGCQWSSQAAFKASMATWAADGSKVVLCRPQTYMNLSGLSVRAVAGYYKVDPAGIMVVVDDADLNLGTIRMRSGGRSAGHRGLESVEQHLGTVEYARLRIGVGRQQQDRRDIAGYVLANFNRDEAALLEPVLERAADQLELWISAGIEAAMNRYNGAVAVPE